MFISQSPHPPAVIPQMSEKLVLRSHGSALRHVCARQEEPHTGAARGLHRGSSMDGQGGCRAQWQRCSRERGPRTAQRGESGQGGAAGTREGRGVAVCLDFFGKGLQGSLLVLCQAPASST